LANTNGKITAVELTTQSFAPFGRIFPLRDLRLPSSLPLRDILDGRVPIGRPTAETDALAFWSGLLDVEMGEAISIGVLTVKQRPLVCNMLERHAAGSEILIPLDACAMVMPFAPASDQTDPKAGPSRDKIVAFLLDGTMGLMSNKGAWHWVPYPLRATATFAVIQKKGTYKEDTGFKSVTPGLRMVVE
jgi:ureidoglycolate hydrolase